jgi:hypothetical protein
MTTQTTPLQDSHDFFIEPDFGGDRLVRGNEGKRQKAKGKSKDEERRASEATSAEQRRH